MVTGLARVRLDSSPKGARVCSRLANSCSDSAFAFSILRVAGKVDALLAWVLSLSVPHVAE